MKIRFKSRADAIRWALYKKDGIPPVVKHKDNEKIALNYLNQTTYLPPSYELSKAIICTARRVASVKYNILNKVWKEKSTDFLESDARLGPNGARGINKVIEELLKERYGDKFKGLEHGKRSKEKDTGDKLDCGLEKRATEYAGTNGRVMPRSGNGHY